MKNQEKRMTKIIKTSMLSSSLCDYNDVYIFVKGTIIVTNTAAEV